MPQFSHTSEIPVSAGTVWRWLTGQDLEQRQRAGAVGERLRAPWISVREGRDVTAPNLEGAR